MNKKYKNSRDEFWCEMIEGLENERIHKTWVTITDVMMDGIVVVLVMVVVLLVLANLK